jgi:hypothetical protein
MMDQLTRGQKVIAYGSLVFILARKLFGIYAIWLMLTEG